MSEETLLTFAEDDVLLNHILSQKPAEKLVDIPEWGVKLLCRALDSDGRLAVEAKAYNKEDKTTDPRRALYLTIMHGCTNPETGKSFFRPEHEAAIMTHGGPVETLAFTVLQLSGMLPAQADDAKKN